MSELAVPDRITKELSVFRKKLDRADTPEKAMQIEVGVGALENAMRKAGFGEIEAIRPVRETFLDSRWMLGRLLAKTPRGHGPGRGKKDVTNRNTFLPDGLDRVRAMEAQRIGTLPEKEKTKAYRDAKEIEVLPTLSLLLNVAKPWWSKANREAKHRRIKANAAAAEEVIGPFPLIYADPPWKWGHFGEKDQENEKGKGRTPDQHYPTLTYDELEAFKVQGKTIPDIAHDDAAMFMWCTSSNLPMALDLMQTWGFDFKSSAVWVKTTKDGKPWRGMGLVFRNMHEVLLYGTRGNMPGPQHQPPSVFFYPRGEHSAKPPEIRKEIEKMYPDFNAATRLELFARETVEGWTSYGFEAAHNAAA